MVVTLGMGQSLRRKNHRSGKTYTPHSFLLMTLWLGQHSHGLESFPCFFHSNGKPFVVLHMAFSFAFIKTLAGRGV